MHGCSSTSFLVVNAEVGSMGGLGTADKLSPKRAAIEKVQAELRQEYDVREERKRELEFLEKGGNPLDFMFGNATSISIQSTSFTDHHHDQFLTSEAKDSFTITASPPGDSAESSGRLGAPSCGPTSSDNLLLFDAEHEFSEGNRNSLNPSRSNVVQPEKSSQVYVGRNTPENGDSAAFGLPRKAYRRRVRSRPNRDGTKSSPTDASLTHGSHGSSLPSRHCPRYVKGLASDTNNQNIPSNCYSKPASPVNDACHATVLVDGQQDMELDVVRADESSKDLMDRDTVDAASDAIASQNPVDEQLNQQSPGAAKIPVQLDSSKTEPIQATVDITSAVIECLPNMTASKVENKSSSCQTNGFKSPKRGGMENDAHNSSDLTGIKGLDSELSCSQISETVVGNNDTETFAKVENVDRNGNTRNQTLVSDGNPVIEGGDFIKNMKAIAGINSIAPVNEDASACPRQVENGLTLLPEEELNRSGSTFKAELNDHLNIERTEDCVPTGSESERKPSYPLSDNPSAQNEICSKASRQDSVDTSASYLPEAGVLPRVSAVSIDAQTTELDLKLTNKVDEDSILKEAQIIEAKRKRIMELTMVTAPTEIRRKSHWDYVLEEMAWLANDFAQERIWKIASAAQICHQVAFTYQSRKQGKSSEIAVKKIAHTLAKAVTEFWHSVEEKSKELQQQSQIGDGDSVQAYAVRFLKYSNSNIFHDQAEVPLTPESISDSAILELSWVDNMTEENLFYAIPPGAMETYRKSIESRVAQCERFRSSVQEEVDTSAFDAVADFDSQNNAYDEDEGETSAFGMSVAFEGSKSSGRKKRKHFTHAYGSRSYETSSEILPMQFAENRVVTQQSSLLAKRPGGSLNVLIPTKRVRTASRRVISPFNAGTSGCIQLPNKTDTSSGDTNSFQDDQSTLRGGLLVPNSLDIESAEVSTKPKKKKKARHLNVAYEQRWQVDSSFQHEQFQRDHMIKRAESYQLELNGSSGLLGQPVIKKPKIIRQSQDNSFDSITPVSGSVPSPVTSQMSNMSNPSKFIKMLGGRDRGRKPKALKVPAAQPGSGSSWSLFEDQALVVLVHDLGPNWELVSDAINSTLHFKCIFRKAKECKERHNFLMEKKSGDGADSAEDSGSSQPYPSTLPGIPKGSARQLFQRLQGPMEEDTIKSHFEKIIVIGQKRYYRKTQNDNQDPKKPAHSSHDIALSQVCPSNLNGVSILTPLELCDATNSSSSDISNQGAVTPILPTSGASAALHGPPNMMLGNNFSSLPGPPSSYVRDGRHVVPRSASLSVDEKQRMQHYNHMISGRSIPQPNISSSGALPGNDRGGRVLPGGNAMGMVCGVNGSMQMARPGLHGVASTAMLNSGSVVSPGLLPATVQSGVGTGQGNSVLRPRESLHVMRPGLRQDRPMVVPPDLQIAGNGQVPSHFGGLSCSFPSQTASPPVTSYSVHHQPSHPISPQQPQVLGSHHPHFQGPGNHALNPQQQAYAMRLAKERQLQHRFLQQQPQQQHLAASNSLMPHVHTQSQLPISSPMQNSSHVQSQASSPPVSLSPLTTASSVKSVPQQKHPASTQGAVRNAQAGGSGLTNQAGKQRQRQHQQFSQGNRQHPQQRQQSQAQHLAKIAKGVERGNQMMHQSIPVDPSLVNGVVANPGNQCLEKGEPSHLTQGQGLHTGSALHAVQPIRQYASSQTSNHPLPQQKFYSGQASPSSKHLHQMNSDSDNSSQAPVRPVAPGFSAGHHSAPSFGSNNQQAPSRQMLVNQNHLQRVAQPNRQINAASSNKPQVRDSNTDQHQASSSVEMDTMATLPQACKDAVNVAQVVSPASSHQWQASEPLLDPNVLNSPANLNSLVSTTPTLSESVPQMGQGIGQRPAAGLSPTRHNVSAQWQEPPPQVPKPHSPVLHP